MDDGGKNDMDDGGKERYGGRTAKIGSRSF